MKFLAILLLLISSAEARIKRSSKVRHDFKVMTGYPHGRPGYVIDHIVALCDGGGDTINNVQWQSVEEAKRKDRTECGSDLARSRKTVSHRP